MVIVMVPKTLSIILPTYNEEHNIEKVLIELQNVCQDLLADNWKEIEIIVIDGGSKDDTVQLAERFASKYQNIKVYSSGKNYLTKAQAIKEGVKIAKGEIILFLDADLEIHPKYIPNLLEPIEKGADLSIGVRFNYENRIILSRIHHRILSLIYNALIRMLFRIKIHDIQCGFKAFKRQIWLDLMEKMIVQGYSFDTEFVVKAIKSSKKIEEVPVPFVQRRMGYSKVTLWRRIIMFIELFKIAYSLSE
jgi:glycosyltransferase involved in cell wall biosynthesis